MILPRIAVTVDMIATGTDVKPLECLVFMRDVEKPQLFRANERPCTRTLDWDDLKKSRPPLSAPRTHYVIVDAIGVT